MPAPSRTFLAVRLRGSGRWMRSMRKKTKRAREKVVGILVAAHRKSLAHRRPASLLNQFLAFADFCAREKAFFGICARFKQKIMHGLQDHTHFAPEAKRCLSQRTDQPKSIQPRFFLNFAHSR